MDRPLLLRVVRGAAALLVLLGLLGVAAGAYHRATYDCESGYGYDLHRLDPGEAPDEPVLAYGNLSADARRFVRAAAGSGTSPMVDSSSDLPGDLGGRVVAFRGSRHRAVVFVSDCAPSPAVLYLLAGGAALAVGLVGVVPAHLLLRRTGD